MPNRGQWGALEGLGKGVSGVGDSIREEWLLAAELKLERAKEERGNKEWERRNEVSHGQDVDRWIRESHCRDTIILANGKCVHSDTPQLMIITGCSR